MWLGNDILKVFFDERLGGMPTADSFGFLNAAAIEIAYTEPFPYFQSLNDTRPRMKCDGSRLVASGVMRKLLGEISPHTYEMEATVEENRLNLAYRLNATRTEKIIRSKIWLWTNANTLQKCMMSGNIMDKDIGGWGPTWDILYDGEQPKTPITFLGSGGKLEIIGSTIPPVFAQVGRVKQYPKQEAVYGWAKDLLEKGTYSGKMVLTYDRVVP